MHTLLEQEGRGGVARDVEGGKHLSSLR
jgi:hypothetical protein